MSTITPRRGKNRCTICHRYKHTCLTEQVKKGVPCGVIDCDYSVEIRRKLDEIKFTPKVPNSLRIDKRTIGPLNIKEKK